MSSQDRKPCFKTPICKVEEIQFLLVDLRKHIQEQGTLPESLPAIREACEGWSWQNSAGLPMGTVRTAHSGPPVKPVP